jgi:hypothetical protein
VECQPQENTRDHAGPILGIRREISLYTASETTISNKVLEIQGDKFNFELGFACVFFNLLARNDLIIWHSR